MIIQERMRNNLEIYLPGDCYSMQHFSSDREEDKHSTLFSVLIYIKGLLHSSYNYQKEENLGK